jgi:branched-chain amino acid transport system substrate-binding protein
MKHIRFAVIFAALLVAAAGLVRGQTATGPIKIGFIVPLSGPLAQNGRDILNGFLLSLDEIGYRAGGREIQIIVEDDEGIPAVGLTKARKLVESDKVHLMAGALLASTGYALAPYIDSMKIPMVYPVVSADDLTQRRRSKWIVRTGWTSSQPNHPFGEYAYHTLKLRTVATIALDYAFGWESVGGFQRTFEAEGGRITQKMWTPISVHDFAPYLAQISRDVDAVYALFLGRAALQFLRQYEEYGLKARVPLIGAGTTTDEHVLPFTTAPRSIPRPTASSRRPIARATRRYRVTTPKACIPVANGSSPRLRRCGGAWKTARRSLTRSGPRNPPACRAAPWSWMRLAARSRTSTSGASSA